jgi:deoxyadenosine/deoxycytidine kinase
MLAELQERKENPSSVLNVNAVGPLGSGKTSVCELISAVMPRCTLVGERYAKNPYLADFYKNPPRWSYLCQTWFFIDKVDLLCTKLPSLRFPLVDPGEVMDMLYAKTQYIDMHSMMDREWDLYNKLRDTTLEAVKIPSPDMIIAVRAEDEKLMDRIKDRAKRPDRLFERWILENEEHKNYRDYPLKLARNVDDWVADNRASIPILEIDTSIYDCETLDGRVAVVEMFNSFVRQTFPEKKINLLAGAQIKSFLPIVKK